ncbi:MAG: peptide ABC transporter substrate-binding protein [Phycisphaeraceae bacterium]|nr:peptide ABC transporter substrate-binding protein [Phycisphaeraceae bacterium]
MRTIYIGVGLLVLALAGCDGRDPSAEQGKRQLRFVSSARHHTLDPQKMSWLHDIRVAECLFDPLVRMTADGQKVEPATAERWEISADGKTYTFYLRGDAYWSNGQAVTAGDYVFAWRRAMLADFASDYARLFFVIAGAEDFFGWRSGQLGEFAGAAGKLGPEQAAEKAKELYGQAVAQFARTVGVRAVNDKTLEVKLTKPTPYFLELVAFAPFAPLAAADLEDRMTFSPDSGMAQMPANWTEPGTLVSNGPYRLKGWRPDRDLEMAPNDRYYARTEMANDGIVEYFMVDNEQNALLRYQEGEVDWLPDLPTAKPIVADLVARNRPDGHLITAAGTYFYNFNCRPTFNDGRKNPLSDRRVRRALSLGIDRQTIVDKVTRLGSRQPIARSFIPPGMLAGYEPPVEEGAGFEPERARQLLAEAGYAGGAGLDGLAISYNTGAGHEVVAQQIAATWKKELGVAVKLEGMESKVFGDKVKKQDYAIARGSWFGDYRDPTTFLDKFAQGNGNNDAAYRNPEYDALLKQAEGEMDVAKRLEVLRGAEAIMLADQPIGPIYHYVRFELFDPAKVKGLTPNTWNHNRLEKVAVER